jgi:hypothetical protein
VDPGRRTVFALIRILNEKGNRRRKKEKVGEILQIKKDGEVNGHYDKCG